jgi:hypothetical protein
MNFTKAQRVDSPVIWGIAGPSGSGKTLSSLRVATGLAQGKPIAFIDTERGRALHYADDFDFLHAELEAPFSPQRYGEALEEALALEPAVIVVDSFSHEHAGEGGVLDMQEEEFQRLGARDAVKFTSWIKPKQAHKRLIAELLQLPVHLILCLRAEEKIDLVKEDGKIVVKPKRTLAGHVGWIPICGKDLPYELTISLVLTPDHPGVPQAIKLQEQHRPLVALDKPLSEETGRALAEWAKGSGAEPGPKAALAAAGTGGSGNEPVPSASVDSGASPLPAAPGGAVPVDAPVISDDEAAQLGALAKSRGYSKVEYADLVEAQTNTRQVKGMSREHYESLTQLIGSREQVTA